MLLAAQIIVYRFSKRPCSLSVYDAHARHVGEVGVVQVFIQLGDRLVGSLSEQIDLDADGSGFRHSDFPAASLTLVGRRCLDVGDFFQILNIYLRAQNTHLYEEISLCVRKRADGSL